MPKNAAMPPLYEAGAYIREHARVAKTLNKPVPKFSDLYTRDEKPLGEGRYSSVYCAMHKETKARRAVKTAFRRGPRTKIVDLGMECPGRLARHEADILKSLDHPNVVRIYEIFEEEEAVHLVLELCEGSDVLERILATKGRLPEEEIGFLFIQMLFATWHLHSRGVIHRDLKPEHFLFTRHEPDRAPHPPRQASLKVIDFGLSHRATAAFVPLGGTPQFMAPEIINGRAPEKEVADRVDMWALGVVLHAMLVGHYPSPHLTDASQKQYFAKPSWSAISANCLDLLGLMLRQGAADRPTAESALKHPWAVKMISMRGNIDNDLVGALPPFVRSYALAPGLQRLSLVVTSHDLDDFDYFNLRCVFQNMLSRAEGVLNTAGLQKNVQAGGVESKIAAEFLKSMKPLGAAGGDGTTILDWTEFLAVAAHMGFSKAHTTSLPKLAADCGPAFRAFELLAQSSSEISGSSLYTMFLPAPPEPEAGPEAPVPVGPDIAVYDDLVEELFPKGCSWQDFQVLLQGEAKPRKAGCFPCFGGGSRRPKPKVEKVEEEYEEEAVAI